MNNETNLQKNIMVCVTRQKNCDRLIARGEELRGGDDEIRLYVVHSVQNGHAFLGNPYEGEAMEYLFTAAQLAKAELTLLRSDDVEDALFDFAKTHGIRVIVMGASAEPGENIITRLQRRMPDVAFDITA